MIPRILEPEVMDTPEEARDYDAMDHREVNRQFVTDLLQAAAAIGFQWETSADQPVEVLDVGTGTAQIPIELCRHLESCRVRAIDLSREMLQLAARNVRDAELESRIVLELVDSKQLPYRDRQFAVVMSNSIIHHIPEPRRALNEMARVASPRGLLFVRDLLRPPNLERLEELVRTHAGDENAHQQQMFRDSLHAALTLEEVRQLLDECGLDAAWARQTSDRHWTVTGRLPE